MSIKKYSGYIVECDKCHDKITYDGCGLEIYKDKKQAREKAKEFEFVFIKNNVYCPLCAENL